MPNTSKPETKNIVWQAILLAIGVLSILIISICKERFPQGYLKSKEFEQNQAKWESQQISHYRMSVDGYGYAVAFAVTVEVKDGNIISVMDTQSNEELGTPHSYQDLFTVPGLFSYVSQSYLENPALIRVTYDPTLGYPATIYIDPYREPCCQDFTFEIRDFEILP